MAFLRCNEGGHEKYFCLGFIFKSMLIKLADVLVVEYDRERQSRDQGSLLSFLFEQLEEEGCTVLGKVGRVGVCACTHTCANTHMPFTCMIQLRFLLDI